MITKTLEISTGNITSKTDTWLTDMTKKGHGMLYVTSIDSGYYVRVPSNFNIFSDDEWGSVPVDLAMLLGYAKALGCSTILLDGDAELLDALPSYDW